MEERYKHKIITIPNILSLFRLLLIPVIMWLYIGKEDPVLTTVILVLSGITDIVDGIIARKCHMVSDFGKAFDPLADKLTQIAMLLCLVTRFRWMLLPLCVMVVKEIIAGILGVLVIRKTGKVEGAVWHGKATTVSLYSLMIIHLIWYNIPGVVSGILIGACTALALLSAFYVQQAKSEHSYGEEKLCMNKEAKIKTCGIILCQLLTVGTIVFLVATKQYSRLPMAVVTLGLVLLPVLTERLFQCRVCLPVYTFALAYAVGPMMGHCWKFYYTIRWWDKLLHISGGVMFAIVGVCFFDWLVKNRGCAAARTIFGLCFSMAIAVLWEFCEFGAGILLGMDMQDDMLVTHLTSYLLGEGVGITGSIENIQSVVVNGIALPGYIDIGLIDSMLDMLLESLGAAGTCVILWLDRRKHTVVRCFDTKKL